ncbi:hypothetical protein JXA47_08800 [Candidatus Sumerlaeota bacterium]|nr:hypothetical protein [Candidatus Sumerlaeota bacterium]
MLFRRASRCRQRWAVPLLSAVTLCSCAVYHQSPVKPPPGLLFTNVTAPLTTDYRETEAFPSRRAVHEETHYFWDVILTGLSFGWGEVDVPQIAQEHGITTVAYAEYELLSILGVYARYRVHVYGR